MTTDTKRTPAGHSSDDSPMDLRQTTDNKPTDVRCLSLTRAHDKTINDYDYVDDGIDTPYIEEELLVKYGVEYIRTPVNEMCVFQNAEYKGVHRVRNVKHGYGYRAHIWLVQFLIVDLTEFDDPLPGLLQITVKRWGKAGLPDPRFALPGICTLKADRKRNIKDVKSKPGGIL